MVMKKNWVKLILDIAMAIVFALLFNHRVVTGLNFHEIAGLAIGVLFIVHILLNRKWISRVSRKLFCSQVKTKTKIGYVVDALLLLSMAFILVSGIGISKILFPSNRLSSVPSLRGLHVSAAYFALALIGIHVGLHWKWIMSMLKKAVRMKRSTKALAFTARILAAVIFAAGVYNMAQVNYFSQLANIGSVFGNSQQSQNYGDSQHDGGHYRGGGTSADQKGQSAGHGLQGQTSPNILFLIYEFWSIGSVFVIITYYLERMIKRRSKQPPTSCITA
jgi:hypothetical protein